MINREISVRSANFPAFGRVELIASSEAEWLANMTHAGRLSSLSAYLNDSRPIPAKWRKCLPGPPDYVRFARPHPAQTKVVSQEAGPTLHRYERPALKLGKEILAAPPSEP